MMKKLFVALTVLLMISLTACVSPGGDEVLPTAEAVKWWAKDSGCSWTEEYMCGTQERTTHVRETVLQKMVCNDGDMWKAHTTCTRDERCLSTGGYAECVNMEFDSRPNAVGFN